MTNLEFIESRIKFFEEKIKEEEQEFKIMKTEDKHIINSYNNHLDILKEKKEIYEQIKTVLEAWKIAISKEVDLFDVIYTIDYKQYKSENNDLLKQYFLNKKEYEIVKKALEAENAN